MFDEWERAFSYFFHKNEKKWEIDKKYWFSCKPFKITLKIQGFPCYFPGFNFKITMKLGYDELGYNELGY